MASESAAATNSMILDSFNQLERQRELIANCTLLWKELSDHFTSLENDLQLKSENLQSKRLTLDLSTKQTLDSLHRREQSIDRSVDLAIAKVDALHKSTISALSMDDSDLPSLCAKMDCDGFLNFIISKRKEVESLRTELPVALEKCIDPSRFVLDVISEFFPVDKRVVKSPGEMGWVCVLVLETLVPALMDPEMGRERAMVTKSVKKRAKEMADEWKEGFEGRGGVVNAKAADVHAFLQHLVTFGIGVNEDRDFYRRLVVSFAWRRQMPKLAVSLGLEDKMTDIIEELIAKGQKLDAVNFAYETGLQEKFPAVPLLKAFLKESKKTFLKESKKASQSSVSDDRNNAGQAVNNANRKEQSAIRAVIKCIEDRKLEAEFPPEGLHKRLENLEKSKAEKKKPAAAVNSPINSPANKRIRASNGGPMPPAKAGRLTNKDYVSSFPGGAPPAYIQSPSSHSTYSPSHTTYSPSSHTTYSPSHTTYSPSSHTTYTPSSHTTYSTAIPLYHNVYGNRTPPAIRDPYGYVAAEVAPAAIYSSPVNYPHYGMAPAYQHAYYR